MEFVMNGSGLTSTGAVGWFPIEICLHKSVTDLKKKKNLFTYFGGVNLFPVGDAKGLIIQGTRNGK